MLMAKGTSPTATLTSVRQLESCWQLQELPLLLSTATSGSSAVIPGNTHFSKSSTTGTAKKSLLTISPYYYPQVQIFKWSPIWSNQMLSGVLFLFRAKNTSLEPDQISSTTKGKLSDFSFSGAESAVHSCLFPVAIEAILKTPNPHCMRQH